MRIGLLGTVIALFCASAISYIYLIFKIKLYKYIDWKYFNIVKLREMLNYSWPLVPNSMSSWVMRVSDRFVVTMYMGVAANAVYAVSNKIPALLNLAQTTFTLSWQEHASVVSKDEDADEYYSHMFRMLFDLMAGFFCLFIAATPVLFKLLIRGNYQNAYNHIPILFLATFFYSLSTFFGGIYVAYKRTKSIGITTLSAALCNLLIDIGTIRWIGLYAASGSTLISYIFLFIYRIIDVQKFIRIRYSLRHVLPVLFIMFLESALCLQKTFMMDVANVGIGFGMFFYLNKGFIELILKKTFHKKEG